MIKQLLKKVLPNSLSNRLQYYRHRKKGVSWGSLRQLQPVNRFFGIDRGGTPIDRYYIESFLNENCKDIAGDVLEIADNTYTKRFGGTNVKSSHVLHAVQGNPASTLVGNLETGEGISADAYDCMILTQTFPFIQDVQAAINTCYSALKEGGVLFASMAGISQISRYDMDRWGDYWRFTSLSAKKCFGNVFGEENVTVQTYGNVLTSIAFLQGLVIEDLNHAELDFCDPDYQMIITVRVVKRRAGL